MNLYIDTHLNDVTILLSDDNGRIIKEEISKNVRQNSTVIMPLIKKILNGEIPDSILVVNGPGSFTGIRLGVTIAKTLAYTLKIPIRSITFLECMAVSCTAADKIVAFSDNNGYYVGSFSSNNTLLEEYMYLNKNDFKEISQDKVIYENVTLDYSKIIKYALSKSPVNPHKINPIYIKKLDVEK